MSLIKNKEIWVYCAVGIRGWIAERILKQHGFKVKIYLVDIKLIVLMGIKQRNLIIRKLQKKEK